MRSLILVPLSFLALSIFITGCDGLDAFSKTNQSGTQRNPPPASPQSQGQPVPAQTLQQQQMHNLPDPVLTKAIEATAPADPAHSERGFMDVDHPQVPAVIKQAAASVFEMRILAPTADSGIQTIDVTEGRGQALKEKINALDESKADKLDKIAFIKQIEACEKLSEAEEQQQCTIVTELSRGTGFLVGDKKTLWTSAHVVDRYLMAVEKYKNKKIKMQLRDHQEIKIFLFNQNGELIFNPLESVAKIKNIPDVTVAADIKEQWYAEDSDFVSLQLSKELGAAPLAIGVAPLPRGAHIYIAGYPVCTGCTQASHEDDANQDLYIDRRPYKNSSGVGLRITSGYIFSPQDTASYLGIPNFLKSWQFYSLDRVLFTSADSTLGEAGGPILNDRGEVIGIHRGQATQAPRKVKGRPVNFSSGVIMPNGSSL